MTVFEFHEKLTELFPRSLSVQWDNDGIMASRNTRAEVRRVLVALDPTDAAVRYAADNGFDTLLVHHPLIFKPLKSVAPDACVGRRVVSAIIDGVSVISLHTRLDSGDGGVNDTLLKTLGFEPDGVFGDDEHGTMARYAEIPPIGAGELASLIKDKLGSDCVRLTGDPHRTVHRLGVCGGGGGGLLDAATSVGCDVFLTGECGYNKSQNAAEDGLITIEAGHFFTEAPVCGVLAYLAESLAGAEVEYFDSNISVMY